MANIRGSYQSPDMQFDQPNGVSRGRAQHHVIAMEGANSDALHRHKDLMDFSDTMKSKVKSMMYQDERDDMLDKLAAKDKRPEIIGGSQTAESELLSRLDVCSAVCCLHAFCETMKQTLSRLSLEFYYLNGQLA